MKKKIIILIIVLLVIGGMITIIKVISNKVKKPKNLELVYEINAGIPFRWEVEVEDETIIKYLNSKVIRDDNKGGLVGASVYTKYIFGGLKEGTTTITFNYYNFADDYISSKDIYLVEVDDNKNVSVISKKNKNNS